MSALLLFTYVLNPAYEGSYVEELLLRGNPVAPFPGGGNYDLRYVDSIAAEGGMDELSLMLLTRLHAEAYGFKAVSEAHPDTVTWAWARTAFRYNHAGFGLYVDPYAGFGLDEPGVVASFKGAQARLDRGTISYLGNNSGIIAGRERWRFGPPFKYSLMMSGAAQGFDGVYGWLQGGNWRLSSFFGSLDRHLLSFRRDSSTGQFYDLVFDNRYVSMHRLQLNLFGHLDIALSEQVTYRGEGRMPQLYYFNPLAPYYFESWNSEEARTYDDNFAWDIETALRFDGLRLFLEWYIDDFQYVPDYYEPNETAFAAGVHKALGPFTLKTEATLVQRWVYNAKQPGARPHYGKTPLGHPGGADLVQLRTELVWYGDEHLELGARALITLDGAGSSFEDWVFDTTLWPVGSILAEPVEKSLETALSASLYLLPRLNITGETGLRAVSNFQHREGESDLQPFGAFRLALYLWAGGR